VGLSALLRGFFEIVLGFGRLAFRGASHCRREATLSRQRITPTIPHPALLEHAEERAQFIQNRIADRITAYAGSMHFVYLHIALFAVWMILIEESPCRPSP
jgi:uncharacterized membrane protein